MSISKSLAALLLAGSLSSCDCVGNHSQNFERWRQEAVERVRLGNERDHLQKQGYRLCQGTEQDCFSVKRAQRLEKAGIKAEPANVLASLYIPTSEMIRWQELGCRMERFSSLLKESLAKGLDKGTQHAGYYALAVCSGRATFEELLQYQPRFRELKPGGIPDAVYLAQHYVNAETANTFPENYTAQEISTLIERGKNAKVAREYGEVKQQYHLEAAKIADFNDVGTTPETLRWYFGLQQQFPAIELDISDILTFEKMVKEKKLTHQQVEKLAQRVQDEDPLLDLLRKSAYALPENSL